MRYRVIAASCYGKNGKVWNFGEEVEESEFIATRHDEERPAKLVAEGFLEKIEEKVKQPKVVKPKVGNKKRGPKPGKKREKKIETASESLAESLSGT